MAISLPIVSTFNKRGLTRAQKALRGFSRGVGATATAAAASFAAIGASAARMASEFEDNFAKIEGLVGVAGGQLGELEEAAKRLGPEFGKSANEAAEALFFITSAGLRGAEATEVLEASLKGSAIGLGETKTIADLATSAVNAYGSAQLSGAKAVDVLTEAVRLGKLEPAELAGAMGQVLPLASNLNVSFAEVGAAMAGMSKTGTDAATASTQLRQILTTIAKPTAEANTALANMGMSAQGIRDQITQEGLFAALETLTDAFDGNIEATTEVFGNVRALSGVLDLMGASAEDNKELFALMTDEVGVLDDALAVTEKTASFQFQRAMEGVKTSLLPLGDAILGVGAQLLTSLQPMLDQIGPGLNQTFQQLTPVFTQLIGLLPMIGETLAPVLKLISDLAVIFLDLVAALLPPFMALIQALIPLFEFIAEAVKLFIVPLVELLAPILQKIIELFIPLIEAILPIFLTIMDALLEPTMRLIEALVPFYEAVLPLIAEVIEKIVVPALEQLEGFLAVFLPNAVAAAQEYGLFPFLTAFENMAASVKNGANGLEVTIALMVNSILESLEKVIEGSIRAAKKIGRGLALIPATSAIGRALLALPDEVTLPKVDVPERVYEFPEVDVAGVSDQITRMANLDRGMEQLVQMRSDREAAIADFGRRLGLKPRDEMSVRERASFLPFGTPLLPTVQLRGVQAYAEGGIAMKPHLGLVGEAGPEAMIPLDRAKGFGATYNITVQAGVGDPVRIGEEVVTAIKRYERASGPVFASA